MNTRMHGGAPAGNRNALKHGFYTADAITDRRLFRMLIREAGETIELL